MLRHSLETPCRCGLQERNRAVGEIGILEVEGDPLLISGKAAMCQSPSQGQLALTVQVSRTDSLPVKLLLCDGIHAKMFFGMMHPAKQGEISMPVGWKTHQPPVNEHDVDMTCCVPQRLIAST